MFGETDVLKILENPKKKLFSRDLSNPFQLSNQSSFYAIRAVQSINYNYTENWLPRKLFLNEREALKVLKERLRWEHFFREITKLLHFTKPCQKLHHVHCYVWKSSSSINFEKLSFN